MIARHGFSFRENPVGIGRNLSQPPSWSDNKESKGRKESWPGMEQGIGSMAMAEPSQCRERCRKWFPNNWIMSFPKVLKSCGSLGGQNNIYPLSGPETSLIVANSRGRSVHWENVLRFLTGATSQRGAMTPFLPKGAHMSTLSASSCPTSLFGTFNLLGIFGA